MKFDAKVILYFRTHKALQLFWAINHKKQAKYDAKVILYFRTHKALQLFWAINHKKQAK